MGKVEFSRKWDIEKCIWDKYPSLDKVGRSFSIVNYDSIINNDGQIDYIIINHGSRVEDHSKDFINVKDKEVRIDQVISHYERCDGNYSIKLFLMDADAPLVEQSKLLSSYIEFLASMPNTNSVNLVGLSKGSIVNFYVPSFMSNLESFNKVNVYNIAAPYDGTKLASPLVFYPEVEKLISSKIRNSKLSNLIYKKLIDVYEGVSSNSHMDYDIAINGGIPDSKSTVYDESFIRNVFSNKNLEAIKRLQSFRNLITGIDENTLKEAISTMNLTGIGLCILDDLFFDNKSDGMVYVDSQRKVESVLDISSYKLVSAHHDVCTNLRVMNDILCVVDDTILEYDEKKKSKKISF